MHMRKSMLVSSVICAAVLIFAVDRTSGQSSEMTIRYLRAGMGSIPYLGNIIVIGEFVTNPGLQDVRWRYEGNPCSQFSIRGPKSNARFDAMYVQEGSAPFKALLDAKPDQVFRFYGFKGHGPGEPAQDVIYVTNVEPVQLPAEETNAPPVSAAATESFRLVITDNTTSNSTILRHIAPNQSYQASGITVTLQKEKAVSKDIGVVE